MVRWVVGVSTSVVAVIAHYAAVALLAVSVILSVVLAVRMGPRRVCESSA